MSGRDRALPTLSAIHPMNIVNLPVAFLIATLLAAPAAWAAADHGHDHGNEAPAAAGEALPRFSAESDAFELVGVLSGKQITLYLDRYADNSPVRDAQIELDIGGAKFSAEKHDGDTYEVVLPETPKPGVVPVVATIRAGDAVDLLAGDIDIHEDEAHTDDAIATSRWLELGAWAAGAALALALLAWGGARLLAARRPRNGGAA